MNNKSFGFEESNSNVIHKQLTCNICHNKFSTRLHFQLHFVTHFIENKFNCSTCFGGFVQISILEEHLHCHSNHKIICCKMCNEAFADECIYREHLQESHSTDKALALTVGLNKFLEDSRSDTHVSENEEFCVSSICQKEFSLENNLDVHNSAIPHALGETLNANLPQTGSFKMKNEVIFDEQLSIPENESVIDTEKSKVDVENFNQNNGVCFTDDEKEYYMCRENFISEDELKTHSLLHSANKGIVCKKELNLNYSCQADFSKNALDMHETGHNSTIPHASERTLNANSRQTESFKIKSEVVVYDDQLSIHENESFMDVEKSKGIAEELNQSSGIHSNVDKQENSVGDICQENFTSKDKIKMHSLLHIAQNASKGIVFKNEFSVDSENALNMYEKVSNSTLSCVSEGTLNSNLTQTESFKIKSEVVVYDEHLSNPENVSSMDIDKGNDDEEEIKQSRDVRSDDGEKKHACEIYQGKIMSEDTLKVHSSLHTGQNNKEDQISVVNTLSSHTKAFPKRTVCCGVCNKTFKSKDKLAEHIYVHAVVQSFECNKCDASFTEKALLHEHRKTQHKKSPKCEVCGKTFRRTATLNVHRQSHLAIKPYVCDVCNKAFHHPRVLRGHKKTHTTVKYVCDICGKSYSKSSNLHRHRHNHEAEKPYPCNTCGSRFARKDYLINHMFVIHHISKKPEEPCDLCSVDQSNNCTHNGRRPYVCNLCSKCFFSEPDLKAHLVKHETKKYFKCDICFKDLSSKQSLDLHQLLHTGEKKYSCDFCDKKFRIKGGMEIHRRVHTGEKPFSCEFCGKSFSQHGMWKVHVRTHTGEKPFMCETCGKRFNSRAALSFHVPLHTNEKKASCNICGKGFALRRYVLKHIRCMHSDQVTSNFEKYVD